MRSSGMLNDFVPVVPCAVRGINGRMGALVPSGLARCWVSPPGLDWNLVAWVFGSLLLGQVQRTNMAGDRRIIILLTLNASGMFLRRTTGGQPAGLCLAWRFFDRACGIGGYAGVRSMRYGRAFPARIHAVVAMALIGGALSLGAFFRRTCCSPRLAPNSVIGDRFPCFWRHHGPPSY